MDLLEEATDFYDLAYLCHLTFHQHPRISRQGALNAIYLSNNEELQHKFLGEDAYIELKVSKLKLREGNLEYFLDFFQEDFDPFLNEKKLRILYNSLRESKGAFEKLLITKKLEKYFPIEIVENYINSRK